MTKDINEYCWRTLIYIIIRPILFEKREPIKTKPKNDKLKSYWEIKEYFIKGNSREYSLALEKFIEIGDLLPEDKFNGIRFNEKCKFLESEITRMIVRKYENEILNYFNNIEPIEPEFMFEEMGKIIMEYLKQKDNLGLLSQFLKDKNNIELLMKEFKENPMIKNNKLLIRKGLTPNTIRNKIQRFRNQYR
jgi:translation initiation factor 2 beta subunit (eIF-2beta)/eIF-5